VAVVVTSTQLTVPGLLEKLADRQTAADAEITDLREQIDKLTDALAQLSTNAPGGHARRPRPGDHPSRDFHHLPPLVARRAARRRRSCGILAPAPCGRRAWAGRRSG
jgi:hypothetical protein